MSRPSVSSHIFTYMASTAKLILKSSIIIGVSLNEDDVDLSRELTGHGISNLIAGALGFVHQFPLFAFAYSNLTCLFVSQCTEQLPRLCQHASVRVALCVPRITANHTLTDDVDSFYRVGGTTRYAGFLLALATLGLLLVGTGPIAYIRECSSPCHYTVISHPRVHLLHCRSL